MGNWTLPPAFAGLVGALWAPAPAPVAPVPQAPPAAPVDPFGQDVWVPTAPLPAPAPAPPAPKPAPAPAKPGASSGRIDVASTQSKYIKDPAFANDGAPIAGQRYIVFGDLGRFYLKGFDVAPTAEGQPGLRFGKKELAIDVNGRPPGVDGLWAPEVVVRGDRVLLLYAGGKMGGGIDWPSFRLRMAEVSVADFEAAAKAGKPIPFQDKGALFQDQTTFGGDARFGMIDPAFHVAADGTAHVTYTVVKHGIPGVRSHEEFVRSRRVDPDHPERAIGPDTPMVDGWAGGRHDGVAEAQDVVTHDGKTIAFISSRAGDKDQKVYAAAVEPGLGRIPEAALKPVLEPGGTDWKAKAVGSTGAASIDGRLFLVHQGLGADGRFTLGFEAIPTPV